MYPPQEIARLVVLPSTDAAYQLNLTMMDGRTYRLAVRLDFQRAVVMGEYTPLPDRQLARVVDAIIDHYGFEAVSRYFDWKRDH